MSHPHNPQHIPTPGHSHAVMSEYTALLSQKSGFRGVSESGFSSCAAPIYYCRSKYFYSQCPQVWNLIGMEHSLNRDEHRVRLKQAKSISNESEIRVQSFRVMIEVTRG